MAAVLALSPTTTAELPRARIARPAVVRCVAVNMLFHLFSSVLASFTGCYFGGLTSSSAYIPVQ